MIYKHARKRLLMMGFVLVAIGVLSPPGTSASGVYNEQEQLEKSKHGIASKNVSNKMSTQVIMQTGHLDKILSVAFSPNGQYVLTGSKDGTGRLWDISSGREIKVFDGWPLFSSDGRYVIVGRDDGTGQMWDISTGQEIKVFKNNPRGILSPDGRYVLTAGSGKVKLQDVFTGDLIKVFRCHFTDRGEPGMITAIAYSPDGRYMLSTSYGTIKLWEIDSGKLLRTIQNDSRHVLAMAFSPDSRYMLTGDTNGKAKLWELSSGRTIKNFEGHSKDIESVSFSPDGRYVLTGSEDKSAKLWEVSSGREIKSFKGHSGGINSVAYSYDGQYVLTGSNDKTAKVWEVASGHEIKAFKGYSSNTYSVAYSPNGRFILSGHNNDATLWETESGREIRIFKGHTGNVNSVAFSPDGSYVVTGSNDSTAKLWEVSNGNEIKTFECHSGGVNSVVFSPDGRYILTGGRDKTAKPMYTQDKGYVVAGGKDKTVKLWEISTGRLVKTFEDHAGNVSSVAFSPDGRYVLTGGSDKRAKLWEIASGRKIKTFEGYQLATVKSVAFSPNGRYILIGAYNSKKSSSSLWDISSGREIKTFEGSINGVSSVACSPDGRYLLTGNRGNAARLWEVSSGKQIKSFKGKYASRYANMPSGKRFAVESVSVAFSPDGHYALTGSVDSTARLWEIQSGREIKIFEGHKGIVSSVAFSSDGRYVLTGSSDKTAKLWEVGSGREIKSFGHSGKIKSVALSPNGRFVLIGGPYGNATLWKVSNGSEVVTFKGRSVGYSGSVAYSPDGRYVLTANEDPKSKAKLWEVSTGREIKTFEAHLESVSSVVFSADSRYALIGRSNDNTARLWKIPSGREVKIFRGHLSVIDYMAFSPDNRFVVTGSYKDEMVKIWDVSSGSEINTLSGPSSTTLSAAFSPDGRYVLTGGSDKTAKLWEVSTGYKIRTFKGHSGEVNSVAYSPDGKHILTSGPMSNVKSWEVSSGRELLKMVSFRDDEWISMTPEGYFNSSPNGAKYVNVRIGNSICAIDQFYDSLYRPDIVQAKIAGDPDGLVSKAASKLNLNLLLAQGAAPKVSFFSPQPGTSKARDITIEAMLLDQGGGIGKAVWKLNGQTIGVVEDDRGIKVIKTTSNKSATISKQLTLSPGENYIKLIVYNKAGSMASDPATLFLDLKDAISEPPALHILAIGINKYRDKSLWLNYAVPDATEIVKQFRLAGSGIYAKIDIIELYDQDATISKVVQAFAQIAEKDNTNDVFILYLAGHGITLDGRYHFLPADFRYRNENSVRHKAINQDHLQKWLASLDSRKSLVLLDTCNSGSFTEAQVAHRGIAEKTAIDKLTRATGRATISASTDSQVAYEGYKGHGVFTYALLQALSQADQKFGNKDNVTTTLELVSFIDEVVPEITYKKWGYEQVPQANLHGRTFPIGVVK